MRARTTFGAVVVVYVATGAAVWLQAPPVARACGGFFCSNVTQPVAQSGEQIAFAVDADGTVTAVVQINWQGPAESFAWIVPVTTVPEIDVGSDALFQGLAAATGITFTSTFTREGTCHQPQCEDRYGSGYGGSGGSGGGCGYSPSAGGSVGDPPLFAGPASDAGPGAAFDAASAGGVNVLAEVQAGPYEAVVLEGVDTAAIDAWLTEHEYLFPASAVAALDPYVSEGFKFVVLRLRKDPAEGDEFGVIPTGTLQPIVLRYPGGQPCIPIRLTAIATVPDMPITAYFLADGDVRPINYLETEVPDEPEFWRNPNSYWTALSDEIDLAGGHAFVAEYRGPVPALGLAVPEPLDDLRVYSDPHDFFPALLARGLQSDPSLLDVMLRRLPPPPGVAAQDFYNCLGFGCRDYDDYLATVVFDAVAFVDDLTRTLIEPRRRAADFVAGYSRLTRLTTTLSAEEMTLDPEFAVAAPTRSISNVHVAQLVEVCSDRYVSGEAPIELRTESGRVAVWSEGSPHPGDEAWCSRRGLRVRETTTTTTTSDDGTDRSDCSCRVPRSATPLWPIAFGAGAAALMLRRRRRR